MSFQLLFLRSAVPSVVPSLNSLELGQLAINTSDGILYLRKGNGSDSDTVIPLTGTLAGDSDVTITSPVNGDRLHYSSTSRTWVNGREPYIIAGFTPGSLSSSQVVLAHKFAAAVTFPANFSATTSGTVSGFDALSHATASSGFIIYQCPLASDPTVGGNWTQIGTITVGAGGHSGSFASAGGTAVSFATGDKLKILAPSSPDGTLASIFITLTADR